LVHTTDPDATRPRKEHPMQASAGATTTKATKTGEAAATVRDDVGAEAAAHALLRLVADHPGQMGRMRAARLIGGYAVPHREEVDARRLAQYSIELDWTLRDIVRLVDAVLGGGLMAQTAGPRPVLVLTRPGFRALEALEGGRGTRLPGEEP
jgi:hypothetical protein